MQLNNFQARTVLSMSELGVKSFKLCFEDVIVNADFSGKIEVYGQGWTDEYYDTQEDFVEAYGLI